MKLIVTIPALDEEATIAEVIQEIPRRIAGVDTVEVLVVDDGSTDRTREVARRAGADHIVSNGTNRGLALSFKRALQEAAERGADIIVNTDADNHYDQRRIPDLIAPILANAADVTIGSRLLDGANMKHANRYGNKAANFVMQRLLALPDVDVSTGFRAYSRLAALRLNVLSRHTYTHETLISALDQGLRIANVPIPARDVVRPSRLINGIASHIWRAGLVIAQSFLVYRPIQLYGAIGTLLLLSGAVPFARYGYFLLEGQTSGHVQSLVIGGSLWFLGGQVWVVGLLAHAVAWNRRITEEVLFQLKGGMRIAEAPEQQPRLARRRDWTVIPNAAARASGEQRRAA